MRNKQNTTCVRVGELFVLSTFD